MFAPVLDRLGSRASGVQEARVFVFPGHTETAEDLKGTARDVIPCQVGNTKGEVRWLHRRRREMDGLVAPGDTHHLVACLPSVLARQAQSPGWNPQYLSHRLFKVILTWITNFQLQEAMPFKTKIIKKKMEVLNCFSKCVCHFTFQPAAQ